MVSKQRKLRLRFTIGPDVTCVQSEKGPPHRTSPTDFSKSPACQQKVNISPRCVEMVSSSIYAMLPTDPY